MTSALELQERILAVIKGATSQHPMAEDLILKKCENAPLAAGVLDALYHSGQVSRVKMIKHDNEQVFYWPTALAGKATPNLAPKIRQQQRPIRDPKPKEMNHDSKQTVPPQDISGSPDGARGDAGEAAPQVHIPVVTPQSSQIRLPVLNLLTEPGTRQPTTMEPIMETNLAPTTKTKTQSILEYVEAHPGCTYAELSKACSVTSPEAYLAGYIKRDQVRITRNAKKKKCYTLAGSLTVEAIMSANAKPAAAAKAGAPNPTADAPGEVVKPDPQPRKAARIEQDPFKCAFTSDGTLMLFGLTAEMIELDRDQTNKLLDLVRPHFGYEVPA